MKQYNIFKDDESKAGVKKTAHIIRGLATSGNDKYKRAIQEDLDTTSSRYLKKYYKRALSEFEYYARINPVISKGLDSAKDFDVQRVKNMLSAEDTDIVTIGAKRVYNKHYDNDQLLKATEARLLGIYKNELSKQEVQTAAFLAKALARSGEYPPLLTEISDTAPNKKLRKYVKKYLKQM